MSGPHQKFDLLKEDLELDAAIDNEIQDWLEKRQGGTTVEPEQMELIEEAE